MIFSKKRGKLGWELGRSRGILAAPNGRLRPAPPKKLKIACEATNPILAVNGRVRGVSIINLGEEYLRFGVEVLKAVLGLGV